MHGLLELAIGRDDLVVNGEQHVTVLQLTRGIGTRDDARDRQRPSLDRVGFFKPPEPIFVDAHLSRGEQRSVNELGFERVERGFAPGLVDEFHDELCADATAELSGITAAGRDKARPQRLYASAIVYHDTVEIVGRIDEADALDVRIAEPQRPRQRQYHRIDRRHLALLVDDLMVRLL